MTILSLKNTILSVVRGWWDILVEALLIDLTSMVPLMSLILIALLSRKDFYRRRYAAGLAGVSFLLSVGTLLTGIIVEYAECRWITGRLIIGNEIAFSVYPLLGLPVLWIIIRPLFERYMIGDVLETGLTGEAYANIMDNFTGSFLYLILPAMWLIGRIADASITLYNRLLAWVTLNYIGVKWVYIARVNTFLFSAVAITYYMVRTSAPKLHGREGLREMVDLVFGKEIPYLFALQQAPNALYLLLFPTLGTAVLRRRGIEADTSELLSSIFSLSNPTFARVSMAVFGPIRAYIVAYIIVRIMQIRGNAPSKMDCKTGYKPTTPLAATTPV